MWIMSSRTGEWEYLHPPVYNALVSIPFEEGKKARQQHAMDSSANPYHNGSARRDWFSGWLSEDRKTWPVIRS